jgi:hypothetical protein
MTEPTRYLIECAAWLKVATTYLAYIGETQMTAEADSVKEALVSLESNLSALIADLNAQRQTVASVTLSAADAEVNALALADAKAKLDELNAIIVGAKQ